eukprot:6602203-Pyramimonas_sp.AAC.1
MLATGVGQPTEVYMIEPTQNYTDEVTTTINEIDDGMVDAMAISQVVPPGYVVLDTAALAPCGGDRAIDSHLE